jgi:hypothetical protein
MMMIVGTDCKVVKTLPVTLEGRVMRMWYDVQECGYVGTRID